MKKENIHVGDILEVKKDIELRYGGKSYLCGEKVKVTEIDSVDVNRIEAEKVDGEYQGTYFSFKPKELKRIKPEPQVGYKVGDRVLLKEKTSYGAFGGEGGFEATIVDIEDGDLRVKAEYDGSVIKQTIHVDDVERIVEPVKPEPEVEPGGFKIKIGNILYLNDVLGGVRNIKCAVIGKNDNDFWIVIPISNANVQDNETGLRWFKCRLAMDSELSLEPK